MSETRYAYDNILGFSIGEQKRRAVMKKMEQQKLEEEEKLKLQLKLARREKELKEKELKEQREQEKQKAAEAQTTPETEVDEKEKEKENVAVEDKLDNNVSSTSTAKAMDVKEDVKETTQKSEGKALHDNAVKQKEARVNEVKISTTPKKISKKGRKSEKKTAGRVGLFSPFMEKQKRKMMKTRVAIKGRITKEPQLAFSRMFADTKLWKAFGKPVFHNYGRENLKPTFGGSVWGGYMQSFNVGPQTLPNYPSSKQVVRSAEFKYNAAKADPTTPGASILSQRDVVSVPFNPLFNPLIINDDNIKVSSGKTDRVVEVKREEKQKTPVKISGMDARPPSIVSSSSSPSKGVKLGRNKKDGNVGIEKKEKKQKKQKKVTPLFVAGLDKLSWKDISEVKNLNKPPKSVREVVSACVVFIDHTAKVREWGDVCGNLSRAWLKTIKEIDVEKVPQKKVKQFRKLVNTLSLAEVGEKSQACKVLLDVLKTIYKMKTGEDCRVSEPKKEDNWGVPVIQKSPREEQSNAETKNAKKTEGVAESPGDCILNEIVKVYHCNPFLMRNLPSTYLKRLPAAGVVVQHGETVSQCLKIK